MPQGKPAGVRCVQLTPDNRCKLFGLPERPAICSKLQPSEEMCGSSRPEALVYLTFLEQATQPTLDVLIDTIKQLPRRTFTHST